MNKKRLPANEQGIALHVAVRAIGNSKGVVIPKIILEQSGIEGVVEMSVEGEKIILSKPKQAVRKQWSQDAKAISQAGEDELVLGEFSNEEDKDWVW